MNAAAARHPNHDLIDLYKDLDFLFAELLGPRVEVTPENLRVECPASERVPYGMHKHQCGACSTVWKHPDAVSGETTHEDFETAHSCPKCGVRQTFRMD